MRTTFLFLSMFIAIAAAASEVRDFYVIPIVAHTNGANGTAWRTDVSIQNIQSSPLTVDMSLIASGEGLADNITSLPSVTVPAGGSVTIPDILQNSAQTSGALLAGSSKAFALTSRTYDKTPNGTFGQTVSPATDIAADGSSSTSTLYLPGLAANGSFRTNIGLVMAANSAMTVSVTINAPDGHALGTKTFNVGAGMTTHVQFGTPSVAAAPFDAGSAVVRITSGSGTAIAYASIVDNATGDASYISGGTASAGAVLPMTSLLVPSRQ